MYFRFAFKLASILEDAHLGIEARMLTNLRRSKDVYYGPKPSDADSDTVPRVVNELLHTSHAASNGNRINAHCLDMPKASSSGSCAGTHLRACTISTDRNTNVYNRLSATSYNPSTYVESTVETSSDGCRHYTGDKRTSPLFKAPNAVDDSPVSREVSALTTDLKHVFVRRGDGSGDMIQAGYIREGDPEHSRMSVASMMRFAPTQGWWQVRSRREQSGC